MKIKDYVPPGTTGGEWTGTWSSPAPKPGSICPGLFGFKALVLRQLPIFSPLAFSDFTPYTIDYVRIELNPT